MEFVRKHPSAKIYLADMPFAGEISLFNILLRIAFVKGYPGYSTQIAARDKSPILQVDILN